MKNNVSSKMAKALRRLRLGGMSCAGLAIMALTCSMQAQVFSVFNVDVADYTIYHDPNNKDLQLKLGGFSGLYPVPGDPTGTMFWTVTDRGPTQEYVVPQPDGTTVTHKSLPCADMPPMIIKLQIKPNGTVRIMEIIPLKKRTAHGVKPVTTWPNGVELAPEFLEDMSYNRLVDPDGLDPEGITMDSYGNFWICEEYRPSIAMVTPDGIVALRLVPKGALTGTEIIPTFDILPKVLEKRVNNRGMEGIAFTPNGRLYAVVQRPLANPTKTVSEKNCNLRLVEVDVSSFLLNGAAPQVLQLLYRVDWVNKGAYASDLFALSDNTILVPERYTDKLYAIDISSATDITSFETEDGLLKNPLPEKTTIEMLNAADLATLGITPVQKTEVLSSLTYFHKELAKCEGLCVRDGLIIMTYDNDFNLVDYGDGSTFPATIGLKSPDVYPAIIVTPLP